MGLSVMEGISALVVFVGMAEIINGVCRHCRLLYWRMRSLTLTDLVVSSMLMVCLGCWVRMLM